MRLSSSDAAAEPTALIEDPRPGWGWRERVAAHPVAWLAAGAIALRLLLFLGRGDYVAFDEGWYLLLGRNLLLGGGFTLSGLRHVALSPLFPVLAGALDRILEDPVLAGRLVAAVAAGLLVLPCWSIFRRLAGRRTALLACALVAVMPSLAPFVAPYWIGWDLWVGAEPLLHLFLYTGVALSLRALERSRTFDWALAGLAFALAYLARAEAVITAGLVTGAAITLLARHGPRELARPVVLGLAFTLAALPYWIYLHDALGRWALTGRSVSISAPALQRTAGEGRSAGASATIERMLWQDEEATYVRRLYSLDPSGTRLASPYWGVPERSAAPDRDGRGAAGPVPAARSVDADSGYPGGPATTTEKAAGPTMAPAVAPSRPVPGPGRVSLYLRALGVVVPWFLWPFVVIGVVVPGRRRGRAELLGMSALAATSLLVAAVVAVDPRTQLFLAPALAFYCARGLRLSGIGLERRFRGSAIRHGFAVRALAAVALVLLLGTDARRLYMSVAVGSPHHIVGAENRAVAERLRELVPVDAPIMSWHPAIALYARRDWRVLPSASFAEVVRYAGAIGCEYVVLSAYYPAPDVMQRMETAYLILRVPPGVDGVGPWRIELHEAGERYAIGRLVRSS